nr:alpha/beta hydrolase [uncultured Clostridium sp.]
MKIEKCKIGNITAILYGEKADKVYLFIHGKLGQKEEAAELAKIVCRKGCQVLAVDMPGHGERKNEMDDFVPWKVIPEFQIVMGYAQDTWKSVSLRANSIGAYFSMLSFTNVKLDQVLFVSPILDMVKLIENMMMWAGVTVEELEDKKLIQTPFGETLDWKYYQYALSHQITEWSQPTAILYAGKDNMTDIDTVNMFIKKHGCKLSVMEEGEHWFHTTEQLAVLDKWTEKNI